MTARARADFDALLSEDRDMPPDAVIAALADHGAEALFFSSNLKLNADLIARLPPGVKVAATCSVGFDHIDVPAAKARGRKLGRQPGQRPKSDRLSPTVLAMIGDGLSYRTIAKRLGISKNTVVDIVKRHRRP